MNKLKSLLKNKPKDLLAIYFTAGYPKLEDTTEILLALDQKKVDIIEVGIPYSDPLADGEVIQRTGSTALKNGMNLDLLFSQLAKVKGKINAPIVLMGYFNQFLQYGPEFFLKCCYDTGVSGLILPDMPLEVYQKKYKSLFEQYNQTHTFLISPQSGKERMLALAEASSGFVYIVSSAATTGAKSDIKDSQIQYFKTVQALNLDKPSLIGFGISSRESYNTACLYASGAIIGSAFLNYLKGENLKEEVSEFIDLIR
ncbi:MAG: tryptophan synthase subunit alpha [Flavobacteriaceae bacterium]|nr:MAG: tryptophan synthase subunit alpha [Flavobacteriaceae bacterium]